MLKYFSELDLSRAYYQIKLSKSARQYTAFPTRYGLMEFVRLPFSLVNACSACAQLMRIVLRGLENVTFYFDNIYVYGKTFEAHSVALEQVLVSRVTWLNCSTFKVSFLVSYYLLAWIYCR